MLDVTWSTIALTVVLALAAWGAGAVTAGGAVTGGIVAWLLLHAFGWGAWLLVGAGLVLTTGATRVGSARKTAAGIAEPRRGRRAAANIAANLGVAAAAGAIAVATGERTWTAVAAVASIATSVSDTVATEIGQASNGTPRLVTTWRRVPAGTPGAVSWQGLLAGSVAAIVLAAIAGATAMVDARAIVPVAGAAIAASVLEGTIATTLEARGWIDNNGVNLAASLVGAVLAVLFS